MEGLLSSSAELEARAGAAGEAFNRLLHACTSTGRSIAPHRVLDIYDDKQHSVAKVFRVPYPPGTPGPQHRLVYSSMLIPRRFDFEQVVVSLDGATESRTTSHRGKAQGYLDELATPSRLLDHSGRVPADCGKCGTTGFDEDLLVDKILEHCRGAQRRQRLSAHKLR